MIVVVKYPLKPYSNYQGPYTMLWAYCADGLGLRLKVFAGGFLGSRASISEDLCR